MLAFSALRIGMAISTLFTIVALYLVYCLEVVETGSPTLALLGLALAAFNIHLWRWNGVVMETTMVFFFVILVFFLYYGFAKKPKAGNRQFFLLGLVIGLAVLTRYELALLPICIVAELAIIRPAYRITRSMIIALGFLTLFVPWLLFAWAYFGSALPTTFYAKTSGWHLINIGVLETLVQVILSAYMAPLLAALILALLVARKRKSKFDQLLRERFSILLFPILLFAFYYLQTESLQSPARYFLPALAAVPLLFVFVTKHCLPAVRRTWIVPTSA